MPLKAMAEEIYQEIRIDMAEIRRHYANSREPDPQLKKIIAYYNDIPRESVVEPESEDKECPSKAPEDDEETSRPPSPKPKTRFVFRSWPRNPDGPFIKDTPLGFVAGNGAPLWGATLYDFYRVRRVPKCPNLSTISTGSKLYSWAKSVGELEWAKDEIECAKSEPPARLIKPFPISELIEFTEVQVKLRVWGKPLNSKGKQSSTVANKKLAESLFPLSMYPSPWPLKPFSTPTYRLQECIPFEILPKKLVVHDPWGVLRTRRSDDREEDFDEGPDKAKWGDKSDVIQVYKLQLSETAKQLRKKAEVPSQFLAGPIKESTMVFMPDYENGAPSPEWNEKFPKSKAGITVQVPLEPEKTQPDEAHLYLLPSRVIGKGNHSMVYQAELEVPRSFLVKDKICTQCAAETLQPSSDPIGADGFYYESDDSDADDEYSRNPILMPVKRIIHGRDNPYSLNPKPHYGSANLYWQDGVKVPYCKHMYSGPIPPSARVSVVAKLSIPKDPHLEREARTYQSFPAHVFQHWSGYNVVPPTLDPVPVTAITPQFYGYYIPETNDFGKFLSPIMLLENCGSPVDPATLSIDDKQDCFTMLTRLHCADYTHGSVFRRNIVAQPGPLEVAPSMRSLDMPSFRLIDFGRAESESRKAGRDATEEVAALRELKMGYD